MKIVISIIVVMIYSFLHAQCDNQVNTNPSTANNFALPDIDGQLNSPDTRYLNGFNWWADGFYQSTVGIYDPKTNKITINYYSATVINQFTLGTPFPKRTFIGTKIQ